MDKEKSMKKQEINNPYIQCPFCKEEDFDLIGLKAHIERGCCDVFNSTLTIEEEEEAVKKVFDWFLSRSYPEDDVIEITFSKTELDTFKQTLEELEEKK